MNETPIKYNDYDLMFYNTTYTYGDTLAIMCEDLTNCCEYADVTVNLCCYGLVPGPREFYFNNDLSDDFKELVLEKFCEEESLAECEKVTFGSYEATTLKATLKQEFARA
jgi:hypothetical protein